MAAVQGRQPAMFLGLLFFFFFQRVVWPLLNWQQQIGQTLAAQSGINEEDD